MTFKSKFYISLSVFLILYGCDSSESSSSSSPSSLQDMDLMEDSILPLVDPTGGNNEDPQLGGEQSGGSLSVMGGQERGGTMPGGSISAGQMNEEYTGGESMGEGGYMRGGSMDEGNMGGQSVQDSSCVDQMQCIFTCPSAETTCRQSCINEARVNDQVTLERAHLCIEESECTSASCTFNQCLPSLLGCETSSLFTCEDSTQCITSCEQGAECILDCSLQSNVEVQSQIQAWNLCLITEGCTDLGCDACPLNLCEITITPLNTCLDLLNCIGECGNDQMCTNQCTMRASPSATNLLLDLINCMQANQCGSDQTCIQDQCNTELFACATDQGTQMPTPPPMTTIETCMDLNGCLEECPDGDTVCNQNCVSNTPQDALDLFLALDECSDEYNCAQDISCLSTNCSMQLVACVSDE